MGCGNERTGTRRSCHSSVTFFCTYDAVPYDGIWWFIYTHASDAVMDSQLHGDLRIRGLAYVVIDTHTHTHSSTLLLPKIITVGTHYRNKY